MKQPLFSTHGSGNDMQAQCPEAIFCGFQAGEHLAAHFACGDLFLFPSLTASYDNVTAEAMAASIGGQ